MNIIYEELDDFFSQLKALNNGKPVFMTIVRSRKENLMGGSVRVMFKDGDGVFHSFNHTEDIPEVQLVAGGVFEMLPTEQQCKEAKAEYLTVLDNFEKALVSEYEKMKTVLTKEFGVTSIMNAYLG